MAAVVAAAAIGVFGKGAISATEAASPDGYLEVRYQRYWRAYSPNEIELRFAAQPPSQTLYVEDAYLANFEIDAVSPAPTAVALGASRTYYTFRVDEQSAAARVRFRLTAKKSGSFSGAIGLLDGTPVRIEQRVLP